jgi:hypothetical protein
MLTLIAIVAFVSIPYAIDVYLDASSGRPSAKKDGRACRK